MELTHYEFAVLDLGSLTLGPGREVDLASAIDRAEQLAATGAVGKVAVVAVYPDDSRTVVYDTVSGHHVASPSPLFPKGLPTRERPSGLAEVGSRLIR